MFNSNSHTKKSVYVTLEVFKYEAERSQYTRVRQSITLHHCEIMKVIQEYNAFLDARVPRLAEEDAVDGESGGDGGEEEGDEERPFIVFFAASKEAKKANCDCNHQENYEKGTA